MEKMREEFENSVCDLLDLNKSWNEELGCYAHPKTDNYFVMFTNGWLRSRDAQCVELPDSERSVDCGDVLYRSDVEDALDAAGIRYK